MPTLTHCASWGRIHCIIALFLVLGCSTLNAEPLGAKQVIKVCGQIAEWPPYLYFKRSLGVRTEEVVGYSAEYLNRVLARKGLSYTIDMLPWKRCMAEVENGTYDMMTDTSNNAERARTYLVTKPYYALHLVYFYDKARQKPLVQSAADLKKLRLCAVNGYNYVPFGLSNEQIDTGAQNLGQSFLKLKNNRCDAMPERLEIALGYKAIDVVDFDRLDIGFETVPGLPPSQFHMMVSRNVPYSNELLAVLNEGIDAIAGGSAKELSDKYSIPGVDIRGSLSR
jgi:polar amino acid transport system substrate-binding protein